MSGSARARSWQRAAGGWGQDLRQAVRALQHSRAFTAWVVGSLAIGMGVTIAALAFLNASMFLPFPGVTDQPRLVRVAVSRNCGRPDCWARMSSAADHQALRAGLLTLKSLAAYTQADLTAALPDVRAVRAILASAEYFEVLGVRAAAGRVFGAEEAESGTAVAVLGHHVWTRDFGGDPAVMGRTVRVGEAIVQIVGVAPPFFMGVDRGRPGSRGPDLWLPLWMGETILPAGPQGRLREPDVYFVGRVKDGVEIPPLRYTAALRRQVEVPSVQAEADVLAHQLAAARGQAGVAGRADVRRVWMVNPENWSFGILVVLPIPILVLVIACVNAAHLMLARGSQRQREIAIRLAIGAGRGRIVRQLLLESALVAALSTAVAVPIAWWSLEVAGTPLGLPIPIDRTVLILAVLAAAFTTVAFGLVPALRVSAQRPSSALGLTGVRSDALPRQSRGRRTLVAAQVALSLALLATAWQLVATVRAQAVSSGTPADRLLLVRFDLQQPGAQPAAVGDFYRDVLEGVSRLPGVEAAGLARHGAIWMFGPGSAPVSLTAWHPDDPPGGGRPTAGGYAGGNVLDAVGLRVVAGRGFIEADRRPRPQTAIVNQSFARSLGGTAVGSTLRVAPPGQDFRTALDVRIVGVVEPAVEPRHTPDGAGVPRVYLPSPLEAEPALVLYVRTGGDATAQAQPIRQMVSRMAPHVPILELGSLEELNERSYGPQLWLARAAAFLGILGLLLATAGLYGVSSYLVALRSREFAIRLAVGAAPRAILLMVLGQSMRVAVIGLLVGGGAAVAISRLIQSEYHGIQQLDGGAFAGAGALFLAAMLVAGAIPAARAARVNPVENLKDV